MIEKNAVMLLNGYIPIRIEDYKQDLLPDGTTDSVITYRKIVYKETSDKGELSSEIFSDIGAKQTYEEFPLLNDLGVVLSTLNNTHLVAGTYAYCSLTNTVGRITYINEELVNKGKVILGFFDETVKGYIKASKEVDINFVYPLLDGCFVIHKQSSIAQGKTILCECKDKFNYIAGKTTKSSNKLQTVFIVPLVQQDSIFAGKEVNINQLYIPKIFLRIREENTIKLIPYKEIKGDTSSISQVLVKKLPSVQSSQLVLGNLVTLPVPSSNLYFICKIIELPCKNNGNYLGISPLSARFKATVKLNCGLDGIYVNPATDIRYVSVGLSGNIKGTTLTVIGFKHEGKDLTGMECRALSSPINGDNINYSPEFKAYLKPTARKKNSVLVEFSEDVGGHSGDGLGAAGHCLVLPTDCLTVCSKDLYQTQTVIGEQQELFIDETGVVNLEKILEKLETGPFNKLLAEIILSTKLDIENLIGIALSGCSTKLIEGFPDAIILNEFLVPVSSIKFITTSIFIEGKGAGLKELAKNLLNFHTKVKQQEVKNSAENNYTEVLTLEPQEYLEDTD